MTHSKYRVTFEDHHVIREGIGDWHSHTIAGSTLPSEPDMRAWAGSADAIGLPYYAALIITPSAEGSGWMLPRYSGFRCRPRRCPLHSCLSTSAVGGLGGRDSHSRTDPR
jgi:hypothetical protein